MNFARFLEVNILSDCLYFFSMADRGLCLQKSRSEPAMSSEWHIGSGSGIRYEHLVLLSLCNVFEDVWQADVAIDLR